MSQWGSSSGNEKKPQWAYLLSSRGDKMANVFATVKGWVMRWPWGDEVLVGIGGLSTSLAEPTMAGLELLAPVAGELANVATQTVKVRVLFNEGVGITGTPTLQLVANGTSANVALAYIEADSDPAAGKVVFGNTAVDLSGAQIGEKFEINASSVVSGWDAIVDTADANAVSNGVSNTITAVAVTVYQEKPVHTGTLRLGTAGNTANAFIGFTLQFNQAVVLTGTPTIKAVGDAVANANVTLSYTGTGSNVANGTLAFKSAAQDFSALTENAVFTINSTSVLTGFGGIKNAKGGVTANALAVANTFTVVASA